MCCEDVRIDFAKWSEGRLINLTAASMELFSPSPNRWSIAIAPPTSGTAWFICDQQAANGNGIQLANNLPTLVLTRHQVGNMIGKQWNVIHTAGGVTLWVMETFIPPGGPCGDPNAATPGQVYAGAAGATGQQLAQVSRLTTAIRQGR